MLNEIMDAVTLKLSELFPAEEGYTIYTDGVEQGLEEPCFFVQFLEPEEKPMIGSRVYHSSPICIQFFPKEVSKASREINRVLDILFPAMELITLKNGRMVLGTGRSGRMVDGVLNFFVQYNMFTVKGDVPEESMEGLNTNTQLRGPEN